MHMKIGLIAGNGQFPSLFARSACDKGYSVYAVGYRTETDPQLEAAVTAMEWIYLGQIKKIVRFFKKNGVTQAVMLGGIQKTRMFTDVRPDIKAISIIARMRHTHDDQVLRAFADFLEQEGVKILASTFLLPDLLAPPGCWTRRPPSENEKKDIAVGWHLSKTIGSLDIGQCVVVGGGSVLAVEAIDGTDATLLRGGKLGQGTAVAIKTCKPDQDRRFDIPAVGLTTVKNMQAAGIRALAVEAGHTVSFDRQQMVDFADEHRLTLIGIDDPERL